MSLIHPFSAPLGMGEPAGFDSPFCNSPSAYARVAAERLQDKLESMNFGSHDFFATDRGQIFGVLVVRLKNRELACLYGFTGSIGGDWMWPGFVPPAFDISERESFLPAAKARLSQLDEKLRALQSDPAFAKAEALADTGEQQIAARTLALQSELVTRRASRRLAREQASAEQLIELQGQGRADARRRAEHKRLSRQQLQSCRVLLREYEREIEALLVEHKKLSADTRSRLLTSHHIVNARAELADLELLFAGRIPLDGVGDCAAPKLLSYAYSEGLTPIALAEFWWGAAPSQELRAHRHFYPCCRGRCGPLLAFMLQGMPEGEQPAHLQPYKDTTTPRIVYEDRHLLVIDKPAGLLSVPGLSMIDSVQSRLQALYPHMPELQLVHRLDQSTSGLLLVAKTRRDHKALQRQFSKRTICKQYIALLDGELGSESGEIELPLRVDLADRPRQLVCYQHGKAALTRWKVLSREYGRTRVALYPVTGRTHQLRVHMAHVAGLGLPIIGDELYGRPEHRMYLHAQSLNFIHPGTGERVSFDAPAQF